MMKELDTWGGESKFSYSGSIGSGTEIYFGGGKYKPINISEDIYAQLLEQFRGKEVSVGTSRTEPPEGSVGEWLGKHTAKAGIACYVGAILIHEGYAIKVKRGVMKFY